MRESEIRAKQKRRFKVTTNSRHNCPVAPNILDREFEVKELDSVWAGDITYVPTAEGWLYLAAVLGQCPSGELLRHLENRAHQPQKIRNQKGSDGGH